jgi:hypothetical protein
MNIIFEIRGGLGKSIMSTAVLKCMRKKYPNDYIIVITGFPDVFIGNENVNKVLNFKQKSNIFNNYIENKESKVFISDPYFTSDYITNSKHLIQLWCEMYNLDFSGETPELFISKPEREYFESFYKTEKPIMVIQTNGGDISQQLKYSWVRDIPVNTVKQIIKHFKDRYSILHIKREDQITYEDTLQALDGYRSIAILISLSDKRLFIDSSCQHIAKSLGLSSVVTWVGTNPKVFGYENNINILSNKPNKDILSESEGFLKYQLFEDISKIPYKTTDDIFNVSEIIDALEKI